MNFFEIINQLAEIDTDLTGRFDSRRAVFNSLGNAAKRSALAATPLFLGALFQKAYAGEARTKATSVEILNYALTLELLEQDFYAKVINAGLATGADATTIGQIKSHEDAHVNLLGGAIRGLNGTPVTGVSFSSTVFANLTTFNGPDATRSQLAYAQVLEDTGVRAYKGRAVELLNSDLLTTALRIHSVEARHAAQIRLMRSQAAWVSTADDLAANSAYGSGVTAGATPVIPMQNGAPAFTIPNFAAPSPLETNTSQLVISPTNLINATRPNAVPGGATGITYTTVNASAAFDEPLQAAEVLDPMRAGGLVQ